MNWSYLLFFTDWSSLLANWIILLTCYKIDTCTVYLSVCVSYTNKEKKFFGTSIPYHFYKGVFQTFPALL